MAALEDLALNQRSVKAPYPAYNLKKNLPRKSRTTRNGQTSFFVLFVIFVVKNPFVVKNQ